MEQAEKASLLKERRSVDAACSRTRCTLTEEQFGLFRSTDKNRRKRPSRVLSTRGDAMRAATQRMIDVALEAHDPAVAQAADRDEYWNPAGSHRKSAVHVQCRKGRRRGNSETAR